MAALDDKSNRPWVGRVSQLFPGKQFQIHWFERNGRSQKYIALSNDDGSPNVSIVENESVMMWQISLSQSTDSFYISKVTYDKIMNEYTLYDEKRSSQP